MHHKPLILWPKSRMRKNWIKARTQETQKQVYVFFFFFGITLKLVKHNKTCTILNFLKRFQRLVKAWDQKQVAWKLAFRITQSKTSYHFQHPHLIICAQRIRTETEFGFVKISTVCGSDSHFREIWRNKDLLDDR